MHVKRSLINFGYFKDYDQIHVQEITHNLSSNEKLDSNYFKQIINFYKLANVRYIIKF